MGISPFACATDAAATLLAVFFSLRDSGRCGSSDAADWAPGAVAVAGAVTPPAALESSVVDGVVRVGYVSASADQAESVQFDQLQPLAHTRASVAYIQRRRGGAFVQRIKYSTVPILSRSAGSGD